jgi:hypothetical protein
MFSLLLFAILRLQLYTAEFDPPVTKRRNNLMEHLPNSRADATLSVLPRSATVQASEPTDVQQSPT